MRGAAEHHRLGPDSTAIAASFVAIVSRASSQPIGSARVAGTLPGGAPQRAEQPVRMVHDFGRGLALDAQRLPGRMSRRRPQAQQPPVLDHCRRAAPRHAQRTERDSLGRAANPAPRRAWGGTALLNTNAVVAGAEPSGPRPDHHDEERDRPCHPGSHDAERVACAWPSGGILGGRSPPRRAGHRLWRFANPLCTECWNGATRLSARRSPGVQESSTSASS